MSEIKYPIYKIFPPIGIARLGNHESEYFIGPEIPGSTATEFFDGLGKSIQDQNYKSKDLKIRKQAARFRIFKEVSEGKFEKIELNDSIDIEWKVKVANTKASAHKFHGIGTFGDGLRNAKVTEQEDRTLLNLAPNEVSISGKSKQVPFNPVCFAICTASEFYKEDDISLGECRTDKDGNLLVLGGHGISKNIVSSHETMQSYANNDNWFDDMADGYVQATLSINGEECPVAPAWVIIAPPDYAPHTKPLLNLYDTLLDRFIHKDEMVTMPELKFYDHIQPILKAIDNTKYLFPMPAHKHDFSEFVNNPLSNQTQRKYIFELLRAPNDNLSPKSMPLLLGSNYGTFDENKIDKIDPKKQRMASQSRSALTKYQYDILEAWKDDTYDHQENVYQAWKKNELIDKNPEDATPHELTKAALENCAGGAFFPGIETSYNIRDKYAFVEPFRLDGSKLNPGDLTKQNALPWQADFFACSGEEDEVNNINVGWWPYSRPDAVYREGSDKQQRWTPKDQFPTNDLGYHAMVEKWSKLGFIVEKDGKFIEVQREL